MQSRALGTTGVDVSEVGLGCWQLGLEWGQVTEDDARKVLDTALDHGITFLDTADVYGDGRSEQFIGELWSRRNETPFVASKLGRRLGYPDGYSYETFKDSVTRSLQNLKLETLDLVQLHCIPKRWLERAETWGWLRQLQREGLIRHYGASVETMDEALICLNDDGLTSLQVIFNVFRQRPAYVLFEAARAKQVGIIVRLPMASGLLGGQITASTQFEETDHRNFNEDGAAFSVGETFAGLGKAKGAAAARKVAEHLPGGMTLPQLALRWILDHDAVTVVIPGARKASHVASNAACSELPKLSAQTHRALRELYETEIDPQIRGPR